VKVSDTDISPPEAAVRIEPFHSAWAVPAPVRERLRHAFGYRTASMMIAIYFPELGPVFDRILKARTAGKDIFSDFHNGYTHGGWDGPKLHAALMAVIDELESSEIAMTATIHATARRICGDRR
jgi:hypothetical protein